MSVGDRIRQYSNEELAKLMVKILDENGVDWVDAEQMEDAYLAWLNADIEYEGV